LARSINRLAPAARSLAYVGHAGSADRGSAGVENPTMSIDTLLSSAL
jgi:hypothetical protein